MVIAFGVTGVLTSSRETKSDTWRLRWREMTPSTGLRQASNRARVAARRPSSSEASCTKPFGSSQRRSAVDAGKAGSSPCHEHAGSGAVVAAYRDPSLVGREELVEDGRRDHLVVPRHQRALGQRAFDALERRGDARIGGQLRHQSLIADDPDPLDASSLQRQHRPQREPHAPPPARDGSTPDPPCVGEAMTTARTLSCL